MSRNTVFYSPNGQDFTLSKLVGEIRKFVESDPSSFYSLVIGTDSHVKKINGVSEINYVTAIVIYRKGKGAKYFWKKTREVKEIYLRDKIYTETLMSLETASAIVPEVRKAISPGKYDLEIHIDVGPLGQTRMMIREVVGMVTGNGFIAKTKPDSWGASTVADKHT